jgi:hypothetical protein
VKDEENACSTGGLEKCDRNSVCCYETNTSGDFNTFSEVCMEEE